MENSLSNQITVLEHRIKVRTGRINSMLSLILILLIVLLVPRLTNIPVNMLRVTATYQTRSNFVKGVRPMYEALMEKAKEDGRAGRLNIYAPDDTLFFGLASGPDFTRALTVELRSPEPYAFNLVKSIDAPGASEKEIADYRAWLDSILVEDVDVGVIDLARQIAAFQPRERPGIRILGFSASLNLLPWFVLAFSSLSTWQAYFLNIEEKMYRDLLRKSHLESGLSELQTDISRMLFSDEVTTKMFHPLSNLTFFLLCLLYIAVALTASLRVNYSWTLQDPLLYFDASAIPALEIFLVLGAFRLLRQRLIIERRSTEQKPKWRDFLD